MAARRARRERTPVHDAVIVGAGLVGLASAAALADRGARVLLLYDHRRGEASPAAAGMLAPSVELHEAAAAQAFAVAARDRYPAYLAALRESTGVDVPLNRLGVLEVALEESELDGAPFRDPPAGAERLGAAQLRALEPALAHAHGALYHALDGAVNNLVLLRALKTHVGRDPRVTVRADAAVAIARDGDGAVVESQSGERFRTRAAVLAAGAWVGALAGLPRPIPVSPVRGQLLSLAGSPLRHVTYGGGGYAVPRGDGRTIVGSTMEHVAFDADTTESGLAQVRATGGAISPALAGLRMLNGWSGLRPVTPDFLPILGRDPAFDAVVYACGHSRNGVLLAPLTGDAVADLVLGTAPAHDLTPFRIERFGAA
jgi:glycine oxidase